ncbi:MAG TPA: hemolysin family protein [Stellaceae bacterium]|nr:hemolysin family protein [Stellaceae bacterium]
MAMLWLQIVIVFLLILLNGFFAMAEMAVVSARKARLQHAADLGRGGARLALELKRDPGRFLSTVQIGITVIGVLASVLGGATLADTLAQWLQAMPGAIGTYATSIAFFSVVVLIAYFTLVLGELVPKRLALSRPEFIAARLSRLLQGLSAVARPIERLLSASTSLVLRLAPTRTGEPPPVTEEEITLMLREATAAGHFQAAETEMVQMVFRLGDRRVSAVMTPRTQVEWLDVTDSEEENRRKIRDSDYSRFPVVQGSPQQVLGVVQVKDLLTALLAGRPFDIKGAVKPPIYLPATVTALRALELFKKSGAPMALVVDEYGDFEGVVTLHDILQSLVGDIADPTDAESRAVVRRDDGSWLVDGMVTVDEIKDLTRLTQLPSEDSGDFQTLGGFMMARINRVPQVGDRIMVKGFRFEVVDMDGRRVDRVLVIPPKAARSLRKEPERPT